MAVVVDGVSEEVAVSPSPVAAVEEGAVVDDAAVVGTIEGPLR